MSWDRLVLGDRNQLFGTWYQPALFVAIGVVGAYYALWEIAALAGALALVSVPFVWWWRRRERER